MSVLTVGLRGDGNDLVLPDPAPHMLVSGTTGSGKSGYINALLGAAAVDPDIAMAGIDLKKVELLPWFPRFTEVATTVTAADRLFAYLRLLVAHRMDVLVANGVRDWDLRWGPRIMVVVDELAELAGFDLAVLAQAVADGNANEVLRHEKTSNQIRTLMLGSLARLARFVGVWLVLATQYPTMDVVDGQIRTQTQVRAVLRLVSDQQVPVCAGQKLEGEHAPHQFPPDERGAVTLVGVEPYPVRGRGFWIDDEKVRKRVAQTAHLKWEPGHIWHHPKPTSEALEAVDGQPNGPYDIAPTSDEQPF